MYSFKNSVISIKSKKITFESVKKVWKLEKIFERIFKNFPRTRILETIKFFSDLQWYTLGCNLYYKVYHCRSEKKGFREKRNYTDVWYIL